MKKKLAMIFTTCMVLSMSIGCNVFGAETTKNENDLGTKIEKMKPDKEEKRAELAKVVAINENTLVVNFAERPERQEGEEGERLELPPRQRGEEGERPELPPIPEGEEGERPELPPMVEGEEGERPELPPMAEGEEGERPELPPRQEGEEGEHPEGHRGGRPHDGEIKEITYSDEEVEITLDENVIIDLGDGEKGSIEDIEVDSDIMIAYEEDGETLKSIFVRKEK